VPPVPEEPEVPPVPLLPDVPPVPDEPEFPDLEKVITTTSLFAKEPLPTT
jgi:hypothetical protein